MPVAVKVCGLREPEAVRAAAAHGARAVGFVFYPPSPRDVTPAQAGALSADLADGVLKVGVFVDPDDALLDAVLGTVPLDVLQLHGGEGPERVMALRTRTGRQVAKALRVATAADLEPVERFARVADYILLDAKPSPAPKTLPGGNGLSFDWRLVRGLPAGLSWMLSGGLDADNLAEAIGLTGARFVDVSSGVESSPGVKDSAKIRRFLETAAGLEPGRRGGGEG
jgi:phosphoribosylanthranilate isomerase